ncbi:MAG TPA: aldose 1-epimerase [Bryobacteraceae bacterium]|nr:aldose 1-epimerase [Bryobacteraceae bacterium]
MLRALLFLAFSAAGLAQDYTAERTTDHGIPVVRLADPANGVEVAIVPSVGNTAYEMNVHGKNILYFPYTDVSEFQKNPRLSGIPFLAPWANRLDQQAFWANGKKYAFDMDLGNVRGANPIHGLLSSSPYWKVISVAGDKRSARTTSRLEFWRYPELMAQWPFAHEYEMTYALKDGVLEVRVTITNLSNDPMPVAIGFHPYYQIPDVSRDAWIGHIPARRRVVADDRLIPTGEYRAMDIPDQFPLRGRTLDDGFIDLQRDSEGRAVFSIQSGEKKVETLFGPKYPVAVVWEPNTPGGQPQPFICFEPMTGITSAVNLAHEGKYSDLQMIPAGGRWSESFWIRASGI